VNFPPAKSHSTKGPDTLWDAPGMTRIKIPFGGLNPTPMRGLADLAEEYSDNICHVPTRQDIQLHFPHIETAPAIFRPLAAAGLLHTAWNSGALLLAPDDDRLAGSQRSSFGVISQALLRARPANGTRLIQVRAAAASPPGLAGRRSGSAGTGRRPCAGPAGSGAVR